MIESDLPWQRHLGEGIYMYGLSIAGIEGHTPQLIAPLVKDFKADIIDRRGETSDCDSCRIGDRASIQAGREDLASNREKK